MLPQKKVFLVRALCDIQKTIVKETNVENKNLVLSNELNYHRERFRNLNLSRW